MPNDFAEFIEAYFDRCQAIVPQIEANAGKWTFEDLIPGLSDFDTRFLVRNGMTADEWCAMSTAVGQVHLDLAKERPEWARNLEHLPGVNLQWNELLDPQFYFTEFAQWSFYHGDQAKVDQARQYIADHSWSQGDEQYHWKKIAVYYGPYNRTIDPPINLAAFENKYPLHSRLMHYMAPPVHSAACLMRRETTAGKLEAFRNALALFPNRDTMQRILDFIDCHYEAPEYLQEPGLTELDAELDRYLAGVVDTLLDAGYPLDCPRSPSVAQLKFAVGQLGGAQPLAQLFENIKFSRLMKGRLWFYGQDVLWFASELLIRNELNRIRRTFFEIPVQMWAKLAYGQDVDALRALELMEGDVFTAEQTEACRRFAAIAGPDCPDDELKARALQIAEIFDPFLHAIEHLMSAAKKFAAT